MANVFGGGSSSSGSCGSNQDIIQAPRQQVVPPRNVSSSLNVFNETNQGSGNLSLREFYTKRELDKYLDAKAEIADVYNKSSLYTKSEVDSLISNLSLSNYATSNYVNTELANQQSVINNNFAQNYYTKSVLYTQAQVDSLISSLSITGDYISKTPATLAEVTIVPEVDTLAASFIVRSSNNTDSTEVQRWENFSTDYLGSVYADGKAKFVNTVIVGQNVNVNGVGLELSERRISDVANPIDDFDAVNKHFMEAFITTTIDQTTAFITTAIGEVTQTTDENYLVDALEY